MVKKSNFYWFDPEFGKESMNFAPKNDRGGGFYIKTGKRYKKTRGVL